MTDMKQQDLDRLKAICEKEGFEFAITSTDTGNDKVLVLIEKKDIWEGVEFAESLDYLDWDDGKFTKGKIYPIKKLGRTTLTFKFDDNGNPINASSKKLFKPSTESAYIEQLKNEAFEKVGNLSRQETDFTGIHGGFIAPNEEWIYRKDTDTLYWHGSPIYQAGKWATRVPKRIEVRAREMDSYTSKNHSTVKFDIIGKSLESEDAHKLAKQLEKYLNNEL